MSLDEYARHLAQKFRLAISLAVIRTKPENTNLEEHIQNIRDNINKSNDFSLSINSSDFNFDETDHVDDHSHIFDEINGDIFKSLELNDNNIITDSENDKINYQNEINDAFKHSAETNEDIIQIIELNEQNLNKNNEIDYLNEINDVEMIETQDLDETIKILDSLDVNMEETSNLDDVLEILNISKDLQQNIAPNNVTNQREKQLIRHDKMTHSNTQENTIQDNDRIQSTQQLDLTYCTIDNTHYSETPDNKIIILEDKYIHGTSIVNKTVRDKILTKISMVTDQKQQDSTNYSNKQAIDIKGTEPVDLTKRKRNEVETNQEKRIIDYDLLSHNSQPFLNSTKSQISEPNDTNLGNIHNEIFSQKVQNNENTCSFQNGSQQSHFNDSLFSIYSEGKDNCTPFSNKPNDANTSIPNESCSAFDKTLKATKDNAVFMNFDNTENTNSDEDFAMHSISQKSLDRKIPEHTKSLQEPLENSQNPHPCTDLDKTFVNSNEKQNENDEFDEEEWTDSQRELIPFKILEEMNKVKLYLNRKNLAEEYSDDTGYKSGSQSKNSLKLSQSPSWLNQSAHCLFNYINENPLFDNTEEITYEISVVLGELIDRLHDEENYPSFLEEMLDSVKNLLKSIYETSAEENTLLTKDEYIERLILLNKSIHIQKFTIEKITHILEDLHQDLTKDAAFEVENIDKAENVCYIFHVLQTLLQEYKKSENSSQNTQSTLEERVLKKSSLTELWKKKWNCSNKIEANDALNKKCPISACSEILNKIIVNCLQGYSLISFSALKCFNVLQK